jgi:hypothetical protein
MPEWLTKQYGPFSGITWVIIITAGAGLGLVMRRFIGASDGAATADTPTPLPSTEPAFVGGGTTLNQGEIVADVIEAINASGGAISTNPNAVLSPAQIQSQIVNLKAQAENLLEQWNDLKALYPSQSKSQQPYTSMTLNNLKNARNQILAEIAGLEAQLEGID